MRLVFMGTPSFALPSLEALLETHEVVAVYTRPDAPAGRGRRIAESPVKARALRAGIRVEQPASLRDAEAVRTLQDLAADIVVVAAYGAILPPAILDSPPHGCVNVHASLLPRWRGAAPIQRAILAADECSGVSIMRMEEGLDTGSFCLQRATPVDAKTADALTGELADMGAAALVEALGLIASDTAVWTVQEESRATYAAKLTAADVALVPGLSLADAWRRVRASGSSAPCRVTVAGRRLTVLDAGPAPRAVPSGAVLADDALDVGLSDGALRILALVPEGRAAMRAVDWLRGARLASGSSWSAS